MKTRITKEEINLLPLVKFPESRITISDKEACEKAVAVLREEQFLGFDTETRPVHRKGDHHDVCLVQLSTLKQAYLFRINQFGFSQSLVDLLANPKIVKTGVAVTDDIKGLQKLVPFVAGGFVEIANLAKKLNLENFGLRSLTGLLLEQRISKKHKMTNWESENLTGDQLDYAAMDAWLSLKLYFHLNDLIVSKKSRVE